MRLAKADAEKMQSLLEEYRKNPAIFTQWHYNSAVEDVLRAAELYLLHEPAEGAAREIRLLVSPVPETLSKFKAAQGQAGARE